MKTGWIILKPIYPHVDVVKKNGLDLIDFRALFRNKVYQSNTSDQSIQ